MKLILVIVMLMLCSRSASAEEVWLVIVASDRSPAGIAIKSKQIGSGSGIIIQSRDCGDRKNVFALVSKMETSARAAAESLKTARRHSPDAYIKKCAVRPGSLLAFRESAVDLSIADVPQTEVNWEDTDRISTIQPLRAGWHVMISRYYSGTIEDALEGRRERLTLIRPEGVRSLLEESCVSPEKFTADNKIVTFQCTAEQAGDELFHTVHVFSLNGRKVKEIAHCRNPRLTGKGRLLCEKETIAADGILRLRGVDHQLQH